MNDKNNMSEVRREHDKADLKQSFSNLFSSFKYMLQSVAGKSNSRKFSDSVRIGRM